MKKAVSFLTLFILLSLLVIILACDKDSSPTSPNNSEEPVVVYEECDMYEFYVLETVGEQPVSNYGEYAIATSPLLFDIKVDSLGVYSGRVYHSDPEFGWMAIDYDPELKNRFKLVIPESFDYIEFINFVDLTIKNNILRGRYYYGGSRLDFDAPYFTAYKLSGHKFNGFK